jgi:hypothetical protein
MLMNYAAEYTKHMMRDHAQFFIASEWNLRNLSLSVGDGGPITLFACSDPGFSIFNLDDVTRLASDKWKPHQWDLLRHNLLQGIWTEQDLIDKWYESRSAYNLETLAGQNITFDYDETRQVLTVDGGDLWYPNIKGVDGYVFQLKYRVFALIASRFIFYLTTIFLLLPCFLLCPPLGYAV